MFEAVEIEINSHCNKVCSYCPNSQFERIEKGSMSMELFDLIISQLQEVHFKGRVSFSFYNEPTLNPNLELFVEKIKKYLPQTFIELYTNGELLTTERVRLLISRGVDRFTITKHEDIKSNRLEELVASLSSQEQGHVVLQHFTDINLTNRGGTLLHLGDHSKTQLLPCQIPQKIVTITVEGHVLPCFEDFFQKNVMGNVKQSSLKMIWESEAYRQFRQNLARGLRHKYEACNKCNRTEVMWNET